jgi:hypothetical protein
MDLMLVCTFVTAALERFEHPHEYSISNFRQVLFYYALFSPSTGWRLLSLSRLSNASAGACSGGSSYNALGIDE